MKHRHAILLSACALVFAAIQFVAAANWNWLGTPRDTTSWQSLSRVPLPSSGHAILDRVGVVLLQPSNLVGYALWYESLSHGRKPESRIGAWLLKLHDAHDTQFLVVISLVNTSAWASVAAALWIAVSRLRRFQASRSTGAA